MMTQNAGKWSRWTVLVGLLVISITGCKKKDAGSAPAPATPPRSTVSDAPAAAAAARDADRANAEEAIAELLKAWDTVESVKASVKLDMHQGAGGEGRTRGKGNYLFKKTGLKTRIRYFTENNITFRVKPGDTDSMYTIEHVEWCSDGDFLLHRTLQHKLHTITRDVYRPEDVLQIGGPDLMDAIRAEPRIWVIGGTMWENRPAIIVGTSDESGGWETEHTFDIETGLRVAWVGRNAEGKETLRLTLDAIMMNVEWADDAFVMGPHPDATFTDKTMSTTQR